MLQGLLGECIVGRIKFSWHNIHGYLGAQKDLIKHFGCLHTGCLCFLGEVLGLVDRIPAVHIVSEEVACKDNSRDIGNTALFSFVSKLSSHHILQQHKSVCVEWGISFCGARPLR